MRLFSLILLTALFFGCATSNSEVTASISESDEVIVCGEVDGHKQTYPTLGDLHSDGAIFKYYGPCYE